MPVIHATAGEIRMDIRFAISDHEVVSQRSGSSSDPWGHTVRLNEIVERHG